MEVMEEPDEREGRVIAEASTDVGEASAVPYPLASLSVKWAFGLQAMPHFSVLHMEENADMENTSIGSTPVLFLKTE